MAKLTIGDKVVTVDDSFRNLTPEQQQATVEEIAASLNVGGAAEQTSTGFATRESREADMPETPELRRAVDAGKVRAAYDVAPWYQQPLIAADDIVRLTADGLTSGYADKLAGYMNGDLEAERAKTQAARDRSGWAGTTAEVAGSIYGANKLLKGGGALAKGAAKASPAAAKVVQGAANLAARSGPIGLATRTAGAATTGAGLGALNAAGHDQDITEGAALGAAFGAGGNLLGEGVAKVAEKAAGLFNKAPQIMTREQLKEAATAAYKASDDAGLIIKPQAIQQLKQEVQDALVQKGYHPKINGEIANVLDEIDRIGQGNVTLQGVDILRQIAGGAAGAPNNKTKMLGKEVIEKIDGFLDNLNTNHVLMGDKTQGVRALQQARKLWSSQKKSEMIEQAIEKATNNAAASGSGGNIDNALRQQFKSILNNPKLSRGLTKDERAAMQLIVRGTKGQNLARLVGKLSPQGNGLMLLLHGTGGIASGGATLPLAAVGSVGKVIADRATPANVERLSQIVRAGGNEAATRAAPNAVQRLIQQNSGALTLPLTVGGILASD